MSYSGVTQYMILINSCVTRDNWAWRALYTSTFTGESRIVSRQTDKLTTKVSHRLAITRGGSAVYLSRQFCRVSLGSRCWQYWELHWLPGCRCLITCVTSSVRAHRRCTMLCGYWELKARRMKLFRSYSGRSSSANCYMRLVRGAVLSPTVTGSASTHSCSEVNAVDFARGLVAVRRITWRRRLYSVS